MLCLIYVTNRIASFSIFIEISAIFVMIVVLFMPCLLFIANTHTNCLACSSETKMLFDSSNIKLGKSQDD